jgi:DNA-binding NarL/FixJ family response regulator
MSPTRASSDIPQLRVLIVEDHQVLAIGLELLLDELGHKLVDVVSTGEDAIRLTERQRPDLIVMNIGLNGDMDGIEAAREIGDRFGIRCLFFTGRTDPETRVRAASVNPVAFLSKTSTAEELRRVLTVFNAERAPGSAKGE